MNETNKMTCVSGYWKIFNKHGNKYEEWFKNTLKINCPYVFFSDKETIEYIKQHRENLPTIYVEYNLEDFITNKYKEKMIIHPVHCPNVLLNLIYHEKLFLIKKALELNPFYSDFFCWVDAGIYVYRNIPPPTLPFPNIDKLDNLPKDKFIYSSCSVYNKEEVQADNYYVHIAGTAYILHKNIINDFVKLYDYYLDTVLDENNIWTDQTILTHMFKDNKSLFYELCSGYGDIIPNLY